MAIDAVKFFLTRSQGTYLFRSAQTLEQGFRVIVQQLAPSTQQRTFDILPEEVVDCWRLVEA